jgi:glycogen debranching enzyme
LSRGDLALRKNAATVARLLPEMLKNLGGVDDLAKLGVRPLVASAGKDSLFNCLFGRDSLRMAMDTVETFPGVAKSTVCELAKLQGKKTNPKSEEQPGRIIHEFRDAAELATIAQFSPGIMNWEFPYYGSVDATPLFVSLVAQVAEKDPGILEVALPDGRTIKDAVAAAVAWVEGCLDDPRAGGYIYVQRSNPFGIENQILEDSRDSVYFEDGKLHPTTLPYAPVAEQGYAYRALKDAAKILGDDRHAKKADALQERFFADYWQEDLGTFAQALGFDAEGNGRPMRTVASSAFQLLDTGIVDGTPYADKLIERLFQPDMIAGPGVRTKSTTAARFLEGGYHNGTVWPTISLEIKNGVLRQAALATDPAKAKSYVAKARDLEDRALKTMAKFGDFPEFLRGSVSGEIEVNPEVIRGIDRDGLENTFEQPPQPQGWTATAMLKVLKRRQDEFGLPEDVSTWSQIDAEPPEHERSSNGHGNAHG